MGFIKALISMALGFFIVEYISNNEEMIKDLPIVGHKLYDKLKNNKETIAILVMGLINLFL